MGDRPDLASLPAELKSMIVHLCDNKSLLALRRALLGDLDFMREADKAFGTRFMREREHFITREGLQALVEISGHAILGRYVERITLYPFNLSPAWQPRIVSCDEGQQPGKTHVEQLNRACKVIWPEWKRRVSELHSNDVSIDLLATALRKFHARGQSIELRTASTLPYCGEEIHGSRGIIGCLNRASWQHTPSRLRLASMDFLEVESHWLRDSDAEQHEEDSNAESPSGSQDTVSSLGGTPETTSAQMPRTTDAAVERVCTKVLSKPYGQHSPRDPTSLVLAALADSGFVPEKLSFDCTNSQCPVPMLAIDNPRYFSISAAVARITTFTFGLSDESGVDLRSRLLSMRHLFDQAIQLKNLKINCFFMMWDEIPDEDNGLAFELIERIFDSCPLEQVTIQSVLTRPKTFRNFLYKHKAHLKRLDFDSCGFYTIKRFSRFHTWLVENLALEHVGLRKT